MPQKKPRSAMKLYNVGVPIERARQYEQLTNPRFTVSRHILATGVWSPSHDDRG